MDDTRRKKIKWYIISFVSALFIISILRAFFIQSYTVSSPQMETALNIGDRLLVDKTAYGVRLPVTILSIPFTFDSFLGLRSYSRLIELPYKRINTRKIQRNDIVLFNNPVEKLKPIDKRGLLLSRCVGLPGDTINRNANGLIINSIKIIPSPDKSAPYTYNPINEDEVLAVIKEFNIPIRNYEDKSARFYKSILLNQYEYWIISQKLESDYLLPLSESEDKYSYNLLIPSKDMEIYFTDENSFIYKDIIADEMPHFEFLNGKIVDNGTIVRNYKFKYDYYWFISDNPYEAIDSHQIGFVSEKYIIGKAFYISVGIADNKINWQRSFSTIR